MHSTYSFSDITATISHPSYGSYSLQGEGIGDMTISKTTDRSAHDVAADGHIMVSKIAGNNGSVTMNAQQTSGLHNSYKACSTIAGVRRLMNGRKSA